MYACNGVSACMYVSVSVYLKVCKCGFQFFLEYHSSTSCYALEYGWALLQEAKFSASHVSIQWNYVHCMDNDMVTYESSRCTRRIINLKYKNV